MKKFNLILLLLVFSISCKVNILKKGSFNTNGSKMYFLPIKSPTGNTNSLDSLLAQGFAIYDTTVIKEITRKWKSRKSNESAITNCVLYIKNGSEISCTIKFKNDFNQVSTEHGNYHFEPSMILKYKEHFENLTSYYLLFDSIKGARYGKNVLLENNALIPLEALSFSLGFSVYGLKKSDILELCIKYQIEFSSMTESL